MPLNQVGCTIADVTRLSPGFARLRLQGGFSMFAQSGAGLHFRFLLGPEGAAMHSLDENGLTFWPGGQEAWHRPVFTVRQLGKDADWMDVDIALHDGGRTTQWVAAVQPGDQVALSGPSGSKLPTAERLVLLGDETAMPVMMNIMDNMPKTAEITAALALRHPDDMQDPRRSDIAVAHCDMADEDALLTKLAQHLETDRGAYVFFAAEKTQAARAREMIKAAGWPASAARAAGYWGK
jgi:NADPH-dependent ferric siderophore reductase